MKHRILVAVVAMFGVVLCGAARPASRPAPAKNQTPAPSAEIVVKYGGSTAKANTATGTTWSSKAS